MTKSYTCIALALASLALAGGALAQDADYHGTSAANFLKIGLGARASGMADAYITQVEDASALYWNPGAVSRLARPSIVYSNLQWLVDTDLNYAAVTVPFSFGTLGLDMVYFTSGDIKETTLQEQDGTGRVVSASDLALGLTYARNLTDRFSFGLKVKYIRESLAGVAASALAVDVGSVFTTSFIGDLAIGMALSNFGGSMRFEGRDLMVTYPVPGSPTGKQVPATLETQDWPLPLFFRFGVSANVVKSEQVGMVLVYSITDARDYEARHNVGTAVRFLNVFTLRGGYRFNYDEVTFSAGAGVEPVIPGFGTVSFDYAYTDFGNFKAVHQFTIGVLVE